MAAGVRIKFLLTIVTVPTLRSTPALCKLLLMNVQMVSRVISYALTRFTLNVVEVNHPP